MTVPINFTKTRKFDNMLFYESEFIPVPDSEGRTIKGQKAKAKKAGHLVRSVRLEKDGRVHAYVLYVRKAR